jgi:fatty acid-binding protein DegV
MSVCILTNNAALFPPAASGSGKLIRMLNLAMEGGRLIAPSPEDFSRAYRELEAEFNAILVLLASEALLPGAEAAQLAAQGLGGTTRLAVLETQQIGPGLGLLAQLGAQKAAQGASLAEVEESVRAASPFLFTLLCPETTAAAQTEANDSPDLASPLPIFSLEEGCFTPYKKVRTRRHLLETLQEFLEEFENPQHLVYFRGGAARLRTRPLREAASNLFPATPFSEIDLGLPLSVLFGAQTAGLTVLEIPK